ncbi:MAG TPA: SGNH/GDSL hydrolase family protein [Terracidiphilus sp.]|jgi:phospholipase/lecithinase/hemolysin
MRNTTRFRKFSLLTRSTLILALTFACSMALAQVKNYAHIVVFGDSLSDTGNVAHLTAQKYYGLRIPGPQFGYTDGRFTDGFDTTPAARDDVGVWIEQLAASMPLKPRVQSSLDGGTDYAYGFAFTGTGTTTLGFGADANSPWVNVDNMGQQITTYLDTNPKIDSSTLFILWGGANNLNYAKSPADVVKAATDETLDIQQLVDAGATQFLVLNLPPMGLIPRVNGSPANSAQANALSGLFNSWLDTGISVLHDFYGNRHLVIHRLDVYSLFNQVVADPGKFGLSNVTSSSRTDGQVDANVNPDAYSSGMIFTPPRGGTRFLRMRL